jgi:hypothetical protein
VKNAILPIQILTGALISSAVHFSNKKMVYRMRRSICLNMIVKNEAHVIRRCLDSVGSFITSWVIVDTGSTDGTQDIIRDHLKGLHGELFERPWKNFGHNRTEALGLARGKSDYILLIDADDELITDPGFSMPTLTSDAYSLMLQDSGVEYWRNSIISNMLPWRYVGVLHEYLATETPHRAEHLSGMRILRRVEGGRGRGMDAAQKYANDARILQEALMEEPGNERYAFYLAQSYRDSGQLRKSLKAYQRRASMGGWDEEVWYSLYEVAKISERLALDQATVSERYLDAYQSRPTRAEPLAELARFYRERNEHAKAHLFAGRAVRIVKPNDILFLDVSAYQWRALDEYAIACYWVGDYAESLRVCEQLLQSAVLPSKHFERIAENRSFALMALGEPASGAPSEPVGAG